MQQAARVVKSVDTRCGCGEDEESVEDGRPDAEMVADCREHEYAVVARPEAVYLDVDKIWVVVCVQG
jgi:hypothetical protein